MNENTPPSARRKSSRKRGGLPKTSKKKVSLAHERKRALDMRLQGLTLRQIAEALGCSVGKAHELVETGIAEIPKESGIALMEQIVERENAIIAAHMPNIADPDSAKVIAAAHRNLMALKGLEAPKQVLQVTQDVTGQSPADAQRIMRELFANGVGPAVEEQPEGEPTPTPTQH